MFRLLERLLGEEIEKERGLSRHIESATIHV